MGKDNSADKRTDDIGLISNAEACTIRGRIQRNAAQMDLHLPALAIQITGTGRRLQAHTSRDELVE